jgi:hypothetical protein
MSEQQPPKRRPGQRGPSLKVDNLQACVRKLALVIRKADSALRRYEKGKITAEAATTVFRGLSVVRAAVETQRATLETAIVATTVVEMQAKLAELEGRAGLSSGALNGGRLALPAPN